MIRRFRWIIAGTVAFASLPLAGCVSNPFTKSNLTPAVPNSAILSAKDAPIKAGDLSDHDRAAAALSIAQGLEARIATMPMEDQEQRNQKQKAEADAIANYETARKLNPKLAPEASLRLALLYDRRGDTPKAITEYSLILKTNPKDAQVWNDLGYCHYQRGQWNDAEKCFKQATELKADYEKAWINLGMTLGQVGRNDDALAAFKKVNRPAEAYANLGFVLSTKGEHEAAKEAYRQAVALDASIKLSNGTPVAMVIDKMDGKLPPPPPEAKAPKDWKSQIAIQKEFYLARRRAEREKRSQLLEPDQCLVDPEVAKRAVERHESAQLIEHREPASEFTKPTDKPTTPVRNLPATKPIAIPVPQ